ncbi:VENN motif pre-toxin domain-containing protein, partial [Ursidibacter arcticus]
SDQLTEAEKKNITFLSQLAGGLASGLVGDSTQAVASGADIAKRAVENNYLKAKDITSWLSTMDRAKTFEEKRILMNKLIQLDDVLQKDATDIKVSYSELIKRADDLVQLAQSANCSDSCQEIVKYSIGRLEQIINNYDALASKKRSERMLNFAIGAGTYGAGRLVISSNTVKTYLGNIPWGDKVVSASLGMGANTAYQIATNPEDKNVNLKDILWAGSTSFASGGTSFIRMNAINASSAGVKAYTEGENPGVAFTSSVIGSSLGYGVGTGVYYGLNKYHNRNYIFTHDSSKGILWGNTFDSGISEYLSSEGEKVGNKLIKEVK